MDIFQHFWVCVKDWFPKKEPQPTIPVLSNREAEAKFEALSSEDQYAILSGYDGNLSTEHPLDILCGEDNGVVIVNCGGGGAGADGVDSTVFGLTAKGGGGGSKGTGSRGPR